MNVTNIQWSSLFRSLPILDRLPSSIQIFALPIISFGTLALIACNCRRRQARPELTETDLIQNPQRLSRLQLRPDFLFFCDSFFRPPNKTNEIFSRVNGNEKSQIQQEFIAIRARLLALINRGQTALVYPQNNATPLQERLRKSETQFLQGPDGFTAYRDTLEELNQTLQTTCRCLLFNSQ